jgi:hypothetical protein
MTCRPGQISVSPTGLQHRRFAALGRHAGTNQLADIFMYAPRIAGMTLRRVRTANLALLPSFMFTFDDTASIRSFSELSRC